MRFTTYFLQAYAFVLIASRARGTSWSQVLVDSALWAGVGTALLIASAPRGHVPSTVRSQRPAIIAARVEK
jgi:hypothetical protein